MGSRKITTGAGGWGLVRCPNVPTLASEKGSFYEGKMMDLARIVGQVLQN